MGFVLMGTWIFYNKSHNAAASVNAAQKKRLKFFLSISGQQYSEYYGF